MAMHGPDKKFNKVSSVKRQVTVERLRPVREQHEVNTSAHAQKAENASVASDAEVNDIPSTPNAPDQKQTAPPAEQPQTQNAADQDVGSADRPVEERYARAVYDINKINKRAREAVDSYVLDLEEGKDVPNYTADTKGVLAFLHDNKIHYANTPLIQVTEAYLTAKVEMNKVIEEKIDAARQVIESGASSEQDIATALEAITAFEHQLLDEEIRMRNTMPKSIGKKTLDGVATAWKKLGDANLTFLFKDKQPKGFWGKLGHKAASTASLRTLALAALLPIGGSIAGAAGLTVAGVARRGVGIFAGSGGGYTLAKSWQEKQIKKKIENIDDTTDIINLKKEYDIFLNTYHSVKDAEAVRNSSEYQNMQKLYCEEIKSFFAQGADAENIRMKQNAGTVQARNTLKGNKWKLYLGTALGGAAAALTPEALDLASDVLPDNIHPGKRVGGWFGRLFGGGEPVNPTQDVAGVDPAGDGEPPSPEQSDAATEDTEKSDTYPEKDDASTTDTTEKPSDTASEDTSQETTSEDGDSAFQVDGEGVYTVQEGNWLSTIWLDKNGGDEKQMEDVMKALRGLQGSEEGIKMLEGFGITSGNIDVINAGDTIDTNAMQEWFDAAQREGQARGSASATEAWANEKSSRTKNWDNTLGMDSENTETETNDPWGTAKKDVTAKPAATSDAASAETPEQNAETDTTPPAEQVSAFDKDTEVTLHTVSADQHTIEDVLESEGFDADNLPDGIPVDKQVYEGHEVQILKTSDGFLKGVVVDGQEHIITSADIFDNIPSEINLNEMSVDTMLERYHVPEHLVQIDIEGSASGPMDYTDIQRYNPALLEKTFPAGSVGETTVVDERAVIHLDIDVDAQNEYVTAVGKGELNTDAFEEYLQNPRKNKDALLRETRTLLDAWSMDMQPGDHADDLRLAKEVMVDNLAKKDFADLKRLLSVNEMLYDSSQDSLQFTYSQDGDMTSLSIAGNFRGDVVEVGSLDFERGGTHTEWKQGQQDLDALFGRKSTLN